MYSYNNLKVGWVAQRRDVSADTVVITPFTQIAQSVRSGQLRGGHALQILGPC